MAKIRLFDFWKLATDDKEKPDLVFQGKDLKTVDKVKFQYYKDDSPAGSSFEVDGDNVKISADGTVGIARGIKWEDPDTLDELEVTVEHTASSKKDTERKELPI